MKLSLLIEGTDSEIRRALDALGRPDDEPSIRLSAFRDFVDDCSTDMLKILLEIVLVSATGRQVDRERLESDELGLGDQALNGVLGSLGKAWKKHIGTVNPLLGKALNGRIVYQLPEELAVTLRDLVIGRWQALFPDSSGLNRP